MLKYEIVSILRNKAAYIFLLVVLLFGLKATVELQRSITSSQDTNYIKRELQYELVMHRQLLESELATARRDAGDAKRRKFNTNAIQFRKWRIEELQELIALLEVGGTESQQFQKEYKAYGVICSIVSYQMFVYQSVDAALLKYVVQICFRNGAGSWDFMTFRLTFLL